MKKKYKSMYHCLEIPAYIEAKKKEKRKNFGSILVNDGS